MTHIEVALTVLRAEIAKLNDLLKHGHNLPEHEEKYTATIQNLNRAVNDITAQFDVSRGD